MPFIPDSIDFQNTQFRTMFGGDITLEHHLVSEAIAFGTQQTAQQHLAQLIDFVASAKLSFPNATHDIRTAEELQASLTICVSKMSSRPSSSSSSSASSAAAAAGTASAVVRPVGIRRLGNNCGFNALGQFFAGAPGIAKEFKSNSFLASLLQQYREATGPVDHSFGQKFRAWISANLTGVDAEEWGRERNNLDSQQIDVLAPLHYALEEAGFGFDLKPITMLDGFPIPEDPEEAAPPRPKDRSIPLQLSTKERDFQTLFRSFFNLPADPHGLPRHYQFQEFPEDLIVEVHRFKTEETTPTKKGAPPPPPPCRSKVADPLQKVPQQFTLDSQFTAKGSSAEYRLSGCILHSGSLDGGHYTFLRRIGDKWYLCNDHDVTEIKNPSTLIAQAYVYHYEKVQVEPKRSAPSELPASAAAAAAAAAPPLPAAAAAAAGGSPAAGPIVAVQKSFAESGLDFAVWAIGSCVGFVFNNIIVPAGRRIDAALRTKPTKID